MFGKNPEKTELEKNRKHFYFCLSHSFGGVLVASLEPHVTRLPVLLTPHLHLTDPGIVLVVL